jgi:hypothetical protein
MRVGGNAERNGGELGFRRKARRHKERTQVTSNNRMNKAPKLNKENY